MCWVSSRVIVAALLLAACGGGAERTSVQSSAANSATSPDVVSASLDESLMPAFGEADLLGSEELLPGELRLVVASAPRTKWWPRLWVYRSIGFAALGQSELVAFLAIPDGAKDAEYPQGLGAAYRRLYELAKDGTALEEWAMVSLPGSLVGRDDIAGAIIVPGGGAHATRGYNTLVFVTGLEFASATATGAARVANLLGHSHRYFPVPFWLDRNRECVVQDGDEPGMTARTLRKYVPGVGAVLRLRERPRTLDEPDQRGLAHAELGASGTMFVRVTREAGKRLATVLRAQEPEQALTVQLGPDPSADGRFVWRNGTTRAITSDAHGQGTSIAGNFLVVLSDPVRLPGAIVFEDGFGVFLTPQQYAELIEALVEGRAFAAGGDGSLGFELEWLD